MTARIDDRLDNWSRAWAFRLRLTSEDLGLVFGEYGRAKKGQEVEYDTGEWIGDGSRHSEPVVPIDRVDALVVENAVCALDVYHHVVLKGWYVRNWNKFEVLNKARAAIGLKRSRLDGEWVAAMAMSKALLVAELARPAVLRRVRAREKVREILGLGVLTGEDGSDSIASDNSTSATSA